MTWWHCCILTQIHHQPHHHSSWQTHAGHCWLCQCPQSHHSTEQWHSRAPVSSWCHLGHHQSATQLTHPTDAPRVNQPMEPQPVSRVHKAPDQHNQWSTWSMAQQFALATTPVVLPCSRPSICTKCRKCPIVNTPHSVCLHSPLGPKPLQKLIWLPCQPWTHAPAMLLYSQTHPFPSPIHGIDR